MAKRKKVISSNLPVMGCLTFGDNDCMELHWAKEENAFRIVINYNDRHDYQYLTIQEANKLLGFLQEQLKKLNFP